MNIKENVLWEAFKEIKDHPEILKDALDETQNDLETLWAGVQTVIDIASLASQFIEGVGSRDIQAKKNIRAAASRIYERVDESK